MTYPITPREISIKVLRAPTGDLVEQAWRTSRPADKNVDREQVMKIDVPVNEMEDFVLECTTPIIVREMFFSLRDHVAWARTSRVDDLMNWEVQSGFENDTEVRACYDMMLRLKESQTQDNYREMLPMVYFTTYTVKLSARTLFKFMAGVLDWLHNNPVVKDHKPHHLYMMMDMLFRQLMRAKNLSGYRSIPVNQYGKIDLLPKVKHREPRVDVVGGFVVAYFQSLPIVLRAQIARHRPITFTDSLHEFLTERNVTAPICSRIAIEMSMPTSMALSMVSKRNCWIAQEDLWAPVIEAFNETFGAYGDFLLPCSDKDHCPVGRDNDLRHAGKDPAPACPLWYHFNNLTPDGEQRAAQMDYMNKRPLSKDWWREQYMAVTPDPGA